MNKEMTKEEKLIEELKDLRKRTYDIKQELATIERAKFKEENKTKIGKIYRKDDKYMPYGDTYKVYVLCTGINEYFQLTYEGYTLCYNDNGGCSSFEYEVEVFTTPERVDEESGYFFEEVSQKEFDEFKELFKKELNKKLT
jgi:hypothetical protein